MRISVDDALLVLTAHLEKGDKAQGTFTNIPFGLRQLAHGLHATAGSYEAMMTTEFFKVQVIAVIQTTQSVFVQLAKMIGLTEGIVGELPIQSFIDRRLADTDLAVHFKGGELVNQPAQQSR